MVTTNRLSETAALMGDPARASMLLALMDGKPRPATDLAAQARVTPQTTSGHLSKLVAAGLLCVDQQGRHRYYRLADATVAEALEAVMAVAARAAQTPAKPAPSNAAWRRDSRLRRCRTCYDHLAGQVGMAIADSLSRSGHIEAAPGKDWLVTARGELFCRKVGVDIDGARTVAETGRRHFARQCLDWSERRPHIAGALGAAIADLFFNRGWARRRSDGRAVDLTPSGERALSKVFGTAGVSPAS
jgi:DNA-binding transcriptional ArsR family regulator